MPSHPVDFQLQANVYATPELAAVFDEQRKMARWLQVEAALATAQGELGIIPVEAAREIDVRARMEQLDLALIREEYQRSRNSLLPVIKALRQACRNGYGEYVHYGATTQDILDTAQVLELEETLQIIFRDLRTLEGHLIDLSSRHRNTQMIGRTHGQQALPITFGLKTVIWASELRRHIERMKAIYPRAMVGQMSGAVGTMAALGPRAREVTKRTMELLNLQWTSLTWHTSRDNMAEVASYFALLAGTFEKIANEVFHLGKTETGELAESPPAGPMSSTMPHKQNPVFCQRVAVLARQIRPLAASIIDSMAHEHERDPRLLWSEWLAMPQISIYTGTAAGYLIRIMADLRVNAHRMQDNLLLQKEKILSEWLVFRLSPALGRLKAEQKLRAILQRNAAESTSLKELLEADREISSVLTFEDLESLDRPELYLGLTVEIVDDALSAINAQRRKDPEILGS